MGRDICVEIPGEERAFEVPHTYDLRQLYERLMELDLPEGRDFELIVGNGSGLFWREGCALTFWEGLRLDASGVRGTGLAYLALLQRLVCPDLVAHLVSIEGGDVVFGGFPRRWVRSGSSDGRGAGQLTSAHIW